MKNRKQIVKKRTQVANLSFVIEKKLRKGEFVDEFKSWLPDYIGNEGEVARAISEFPECVEEIDGFCEEKAAKMLSSDSKTDKVFVKKYAWNPRIKKQRSAAWRRTVDEWRRAREGKIEETHYWQDWETGCSCDACIEKRLIQEWMDKDD